AALRGRRHAADAVTLRAMRSGPAHQPPLRHDPDRSGHWWPGGYDHGLRPDDRPGHRLFVRALRSVAAVRDGGPSGRDLSARSDVGSIAAASHAGGRLLGSFGSAIRITVSERDGGPAGQANRRARSPGRPTVTSRHPRAYEKRARFVSPALGWLSVITPLGSVARQLLSCRSLLPSRPAVLRLG